jgi:transposase
MARGDLTDEEWFLIEPHLPLGERGPIPDLRQQFNAVMWRFRAGCPWRDLPAEYGPWSTVYDRFRSWARSGVFERLMQAMIAEAAVRGQADLGLVSVDSTTARAHHHAAGMVLDGELAEALEEAVEQEKGMRQRGKTPTTATLTTETETETETETGVGGYDGGAGSG